ncbi:unnamed protein product [Rotaria sp. Silwood2]|nr:unnamed protein product [Rotaria sp. Silwood2]CAF3163772.1 unnamed protein product [Rotaria sp. Silwood2]CAF4019816.1 unnamed protein product [Rotaria sp. Silwood2]
MLQFIVLFALVRFSFTYTLIQPRQSVGINEVAALISSENCQFYLSLNTHFQCGVKSHLTQYSYKYCQRLLDIRNLFENTKYQDNVRQCLQQKLLTKIQQVGEMTITCDSFKQIDLDSHQSCLAVSFKELSVNDVKQFIASFKDTTVNYAQLCKLANSFAGHWSQVVNGDLMMFLKRQLKEIFTDGDTSTCIIKEKDIIDEIDEIVSEIGTVLDKVKSVKEDISLIIEKSKAIRDDFKTIRQIVKQMNNGTVSNIDGLKAILAKTKTIVANSKVIIETIKNLGKDKTNTGVDQNQTEKPTTELGQLENAQNALALMQISQVISQFNGLKEEVYNVIDNVNSIVDIVDEIRDGKKNVADGISDIIGQIEQGIDNIYSIIDTSYTLKDTVFDLVESIHGSMGGIVDELVDNGKETVDEIIGGVTGSIGGGLNGIGK